MTAQGKPPRTVCPARGTLRTVPGKGEATAFPATVSVSSGSACTAETAACTSAADSGGVAAALSVQSGCPFSTVSPSRTKTSVTTLLFSGTSDTVREGTTEPNTVTLL